MNRIVQQRLLCLRYLARCFSLPFDVRSEPPAQACAFVIPYHATYHVDTPSIRSPPVTFVLPVDTFSLSLFSFSFSLFFSFLCFVSCVCVCVCDNFTHFCLSIYHSFHLHCTIFKLALSLSLLLLRFHSPGTTYANWNFGIAMTHTLLVHTHTPKHTGTDSRNGKSFQRITYNNNNQNKNKIKHTHTLTRLIVAPPSLLRGVAVGGKSRSRFTGRPPLFVVTRLRRTRICHHHQPVVPGVSGGPVPYPLVSAGRRESRPRRRKQRRRTRRTKRRKTKRRTTAFGVARPSGWATRATTRAKMTRRRAGSRQPHCSPRPPPASRTSRCSSGASAG